MSKHTDAHEMTDTYIRLHISPFSPDLFTAILQPSQVASARNISYHRIQTSPDHGYGYIDLPSMAADKLKQKFNGAILKGTKLKIESARPSKRRRLDADVDIRNAFETRSEPKSAVGKRTTVDDHNVAAGHEVEAGRKIKRGWTNPERKSKKAKGTTSQPASKYSEKQEMLFTTNLPPNKTDASTSRSKQKAKRSKDSQIVHEFAKSVTQPSFLRVDVAKNPSTGAHYVDGQGWVSEDGTLIEQETEQSKRTRLVASKVRNGQVGLKKEPANDLRTSSISSSPSLASETSSSASSDASDEAEEATPGSPPHADADAVDNITSDEDSTDTSNSPSDSRGQFPVDVPTIVLPEANPGENNAAETQSDVHPLEALFKKPPTPLPSADIVKPSLEISTSFSFFDAMDSEDINEDQIVPMTPFSSQDMRNRGLRSAAPTPDTAHPSRFPSLGSGGYAEDDEVEDGTEYFSKADLELETTGESAAQTTVQKVSEFEKKFWENRGDNNRAWKNRRRTVLKEKRQRENRARRPKNW